MSVPLYGFSCSSDNCIALKASQYKMSAELPESMKTLFTTEGKACCPIDRTSSVERLAYHFLAELDSPPPANPSAI
ncbi:hypothetical protein A2U01_0065126, partial [Trifolium medium]|nr:hypothetical protein [Trifolium medium]